MSNCTITNPVTEVSVSKKMRISDMTFYRKLWGKIKESCASVYCQNGSCIFILLSAFFVSFKILRSGLKPWIVLEMVNWYKFSKWKYYFGVLMGNKEMNEFMSKCIACKASKNLSVHCMIEALHSMILGLSAVLQNTFVDLIIRLVSHHTSSSNCCQVHVFACWCLFSHLNATQM